MMETKYYVVTRIDGDYAWLKRTDTGKDEEPVFIARALLPEGVKASSFSMRSSDRYVLQILLRRF